MEVDGQAAVFRGPRTKTIGKRSEMDSLQPKLRADTYVPEPFGFVRHCNGFEISHLDLISTPAPPMPIAELYTGLDPDFAGGDWLRQRG
eukprot:12735931-Prorocentrum_lima.AAC.1